MGWLLATTPCVEVPVRFAAFVTLWEITELANEHFTLYSGACMCVCSIGDVLLPQ